MKANTRDIFEEASKDSDGAVQVNGSCIKYRWLGKDYWVDYGDCRLTVSPTQKHFRKVNGEWPNYLMPIPANEMTKANGTLVQNPGYKCIANTRSMKLNIRKITEVDVL